MASLRWRKDSNRWEMSWKDASGRWRKKCAFRDKGASAQLLAEKEREAARQMAGLSDPFEKHSRVPLSQHLDDLITHLRDKGNRKKNIRQTKSELTLAFKEMGAVYPKDLTPERAERFLLCLVEEKKLAPKTRNSYFASLRLFAIWGVKRERWPRNPFTTLSKVKVEHDIRRPRRALTEDELIRLIEAAETRPVDGWLRTHPNASAEKLEELRCKGRERGLIYWFAVLTGLRLNEIRTLRWASIDLESDVPSLTVEARHSKARRKERIPLPPGLAENLRAWRKFNSADAGRVFDVPLHLIRHFKKDCEAARIPLVDAAGRFMDVHALRHTTATLLSKTKATPRAAQAHMRHSDIRQTMKTYTHHELIDMQRVANALEGHLNECAAENLRKTPRALPRGSAPRCANLQEQSKTPSGGGPYNSRVPAPHCTPSQEPASQTDWSGRLDLNQRPHRPERCALPPAPRPDALVFLQRICYYSSRLSVRQQFARGFARACGLYF